MNVTGVREIPGEFPTYSFFYKSDNLKVRGFIIFPKEISNKHPLVFINRGGTGDVGMFTDENIKHFNFFSKEGYITVMTQYRGCDGGDGFDRMGGDDIFDIINLYKIVSELTLIDTDNIGMWGVSRGGMMMFQVASRVNWIKAMIAVSPIVDEVDMASWRPGWKEHQEQIYGGSYSEQYKRSPLHWIKNIPKIPLMFFVGMKDERINPEKVVEMGKIMDVPVIIFPDDGHFISAKTVERSVEFLNTHLKKNIPTQ